MYYKKALKLQAYLDMLEDGGSCFLYSCLINSAKTPGIMVTYSGLWLCFYTGSVCLIFFPIRYKFIACGRNS